MSNEKYKMFKQFMSNELDITKDDIKEWVKEAAEDTIQRFIDNQYEKFSINDLVYKAMGKYDIFDSNRKLSYELRSEIAEKIGEKILEQVMK